MITNVLNGRDMLVGWSDGSFTTHKTLQNVKPGVYFATILEIDGKAVPCIHSTTPAVLEVKGEGSCEPNLQL
tara:strand:- start:1180 stop:1395 length:216 start_codon:yes stop_codon:yes gene_type:complete